VSACRRILGDLTAWVDWDLVHSRFMAGAGRGLIKPAFFIIVCSGAVGVSRSLQSCSTTIFELRISCWLFLYEFLVVPDLPLKVTRALNGNCQAVLSGPVFHFYFGSCLAIAIAGGTLGHYILHIDSTTNVRTLIKYPCLHEIHAFFRANLHARKLYPSECDEVLSSSVAAQIFKCCDFL
jgi:hypothetical protein